MSSKKQTAVEWLVESLKELGVDLLSHNLEIQQAKALEKMQIIEAYEQGEAEWTPVDFRTAQGYFIETYGQ
jgi:hypothetical protein